MNSHLPDILSRSISSVTCGIAVISAAILIVVKLSRSSNLDGIPAVGSSHWLGSWWAGLTFLINGPDVLQEGYEKYKSAPFKVAELYRWVVVLSSREHVDELWRAPDDVLSLADAINDQLHLDYILGPQIRHNRYHVPILRLRLTRNIEVLYPEIMDEITAAFSDVLDLRDNEWKCVLALGSMEKVVCRTSNRVFVGLPLCRNPEWIDLNTRYTIDVIKGGLIIGLFPDVLKPVAVRFLTNVSKGNQCARKILGPIVEERVKYLNERSNDWADKPNQFLSWLIEDAEGPELTVESLAARLLLVNIGAIHTSSVSFTHALFYLAANPEHMQPLREEVETVIKEQGWSKSALDRMRKVDSFLKECQRLDGSSTSTSLMRKALKDFTFSDGTFVPKGTMIFAAARCIHHDEAYYEDAHTFKPFRFADMHGKDSEGTKHQFVATTAEYLAFGHGRNACPGRFFAANELKSMLAYVVLTFDIKFPEDAPRPRTLRLSKALIPDPKAKIMFRRRVT